MTKRCIQTLMVFVLLGGGISACGSKGAGAGAELNSIDDVMQQAVADGADEFAPVEMRFAREKQRLAQAAMKAKKYTKAEMLSREAKIDAKLAGALATAARSRHALEGLNDNMLQRPEGSVQKTSASPRDSLRALIDGE
jgi:hypothetical protein